MIDNYTMYAAKDLREGLGRIFSLLGILQRPPSKEKKRAFNNQYTEIVAEKDKDKLSCLFKFITRIEQWATKSGETKLTMEDIIEDARESLNDPIPPRISSEEK